MPFSCVSHNPLLEEPGERKERFSGTTRFDMHVHSVYSNDSITDIKTIVRSWEKTGILPLVCDHDTLMGSKKVYAEIRRNDPDIPLILAEEILTSDGEIIGAFLNEEVPPGLRADETLDIIEDQGALSIVPHPFCTFRSTTIDRKILSEISDRVDIIEGFNARTPGGEENHMGRVFAKSCGKPVSVGSDAHTPVELSRNYITIESFSTPAELIRNIRSAGICFMPAPKRVREFTIFLKRLQKESSSSNTINKKIASILHAAVALPP